MTIDPPPQEYRRARIAELCKELFSVAGDNYDTDLAHCRRASALFHQLLAESLSPSFNRHIAESHASSLQEKKSLARQTNSQLRDLDLVIVCPKTRQASLLQAVAERDPERGRFQLRLVAGEQRRRRTVTTSVLPELSLTFRGTGAPDVPWGERVARKPAESERDLDGGRNE